jgi:hypothetical protein
MHTQEDDDANLVILDIINNLTHPFYNGQTAYFDVAILETETVNISRGVTPICLPR